MDVMQLSILEYRAEHQPWFEKLNRDWIEKYFWMEPIDIEVLQHPDDHIINSGGAILMMQCDREIVGACALKFVSPGVYEFTKMAIAEKFRGQKLGQTLTEAAIEKARSLGAYKVILYSSTKLVPAISMYRKLGFIEVPLDGPYKRSDIKMEMPLIPVNDPDSDEEFKLRKATSKDAGLLCALGIQTFRDSFEAENTPENMNLFLQKFSPEKIREEMREPGAVFLLLEHGKSVVGYVKLRTGHDPKDLGNIHAIEIERLYSVKQYIGKHAGKMLMENAIQYAKDHGFKAIWLGVWEFNPRAIRFYQKFGFEKFGSHVFVVGTDPQTDHLMKKILN